MKQDQQIIYRNQSHQDHLQYEIKRREFENQKAMQHENSSDRY